MPDTHEVIYEVNIAVPARLTGEYASFLEFHIPQILKIDGFRECRWYQRHASDEGGREDPGECLWTLHYSVRDRAAIDRYISEMAPKMRAEGQARFGGEVRIGRRILEGFRVVGG